LRVIVRRERPHPGAQLSLFDQRDGLRYQAFATDTPVGQLAHLEARHRAHARVEDRIRCGNDTGIGRFPSRVFAINAAWLELASLGSEAEHWIRRSTYFIDRRHIERLQPHPVRVFIDSNITGRREFVPQIVPRPPLPDAFPADLALAPMPSASCLPGARPCVGVAGSALANQSAMPRWSEAACQSSEAEPSEAGHAWPEHGVSVTRSRLAYLSLGRATKRTLCAAGTVAGEGPAADRGRRGRVMRASA
jgi:hypothetical protein